MKTIDTIGAQGDVLFVRVKDLPAGLEEIAREAGSAAVVAHSETGHHHVIAAPVRHYRNPADPFVAYIQVPGAVPAGSVQVEHLREWDTHETLNLDHEAGREDVWMVRRQREWTIEGWRMSQD